MMKKTIGLLARTPSLFLIALLSGICCFIAISVGESAEMRQLDNVATSSTDSVMLYPETQSLIFENESLAVSQYALQQRRENLFFQHPSVENHKGLVSYDSLAKRITPRYALTNEERELVCKVVMAECGAEPYDGIIAVTQCILNACIESGLRPREVIREYGYTSTRKMPSPLVRKAVRDVFDRGVTITDEFILYFYAQYGNGGWHETQKFVCEIGGHRFFAPHDKDE